MLDPLNFSVKPGSLST